MPHTTTRSLPAALIAAAFLSFSCANQIPPSGGPVDDQGPQVVYVHPEPFSLNVSTDFIEIEFDEFVDKRTAIESIFISPPIDGMEFDWWGKTLEISFPAQLKANTTYVVSVGTDITDLEPSRRNRMARAFSFPFATGPTIDRGLITGTVLPVDPKDELGGVMVYAFHLPTGRADTLNVLHASPTYVTQSGRDGSFAFPHIQLASYFVLSIRDVSRNIVYDREEDEYAVPTRPVRLSRLDTSFTGLVLQLTKEDTTGPRLTAVTPIDLNHVQVEFSEPFDTVRHRRPVASIVDTLSGERRTVYTVTPVLPGRKQALLTTDFLDPTAVYRLTLDGLIDPAGNEAVGGTTSRVFTPTATADTLPPVLQRVSVRDSATDRSVFEDILFSFSEPLSTDLWSGERARLISAADGEEHPVETRWVTESILGIKPVGELRSYAWYTLEVLLHGLHDWKLESVQDSVSIVRFRTEDVYDTGTIEGRVVVRSDSDTAGPVIVVARPTEAKPEDHVQTEAAGDGSFAVRRLRTGPYTLHAFKDRNGNGVYDAGEPYPYRPSERRSPWSDTLKVRSRWPLEGVRLHIP